MDEPCASNDIPFYLSDPPPPDFRGVIPRVVVSAKISDTLNMDSFCNLAFFAGKLSRVWAHLGVLHATNQISHEACSLFSTILASGNWTIIASVRYGFLVVN